MTTTPQPAVPESHSVLGRLAPPNDGCIFEMLVAGRSPPDSVQPLSSLSSLSTTKKSTTSMAVSFVPFGRLIHVLVHGRQVQVWHCCERVISVHALAERGDVYALTLAVAGARGGVWVFRTSGGPLLRRAGRKRKAGSEAHEREGSVGQDMGAAAAAEDADTVSASYSDLLASPAGSAHSPPSWSVATAEATSAAAASVAPAQGVAPHLTPLPSVMPTTQQHLTPETALVCGAVQQKDLTPLQTLREAIAANDIAAAATGSWVQGSLCLCHMEKKDGQLCLVSLGTRYGGEQWIYTVWSLGVPSISSASEGTTSTSTSGSASTFTTSYPEANVVCQLIFPTALIVTTPILPKTPHADTHIASGSYHQSGNSICASGDPDLTKLGFLRVFSVSSITEKRATLAPSESSSAVLAPALFAALFTSSLALTREQVVVAGVGGRVLWRPLREPETSTGVDAAISGSGGSCSHTQWRILYQRPANILLAASAHLDHGTSSGTYEYGAEDDGGLANALVLVDADGCILLLSQAPGPNSTSSLPTTATAIAARRSDDGSVAHGVHVAPLAADGPLRNAVLTAGNILALLRCDGVLLMAKISAAMQTGSASLVCLTVPCGGARSIAASAKGTDLVVLGHDGVAVVHCALRLYAAAEAAALHAVPDDAAASGGSGASTAGPDLSSTMKSLVAVGEQLAAERAAEARLDRHLAILNTCSAIVQHAAAANTNTTTAVSSGRKKNARRLSCRLAPVFRPLQATPARGLHLVVRLTNEMGMALDGTYWTLQVSCRGAMGLTAAASVPLAKCCIPPGASWQTEVSLSDNVTTAMSALEKGYQYHHHQQLVPPLVLQCTLIGVVPDMVRGVSVPLLHQQTWDDIDLLQDAQSLHGRPVAACTARTNCISASAQLASAVAHVNTRPAGVSRGGLAGGERGGMGYSAVRGGGDGGGGGGGGDVAFGGISNVQTDWGPIYGERSLLQSPGATGGHNTTSFSLKIGPFAVQRLLGPETIATAANAPEHVLRALLHGSPYEKRKVRSGPRAHVLLWRGGVIELIAAPSDEVGLNGGGGGAQDNSSGVVLTLRGTSRDALRLRRALAERAIRTCSLAPNGHGDGPVMVNPGMVDVRSIKSLEAAQEDLARIQDELALTATAPSSNQQHALSQLLMARHRLLLHPGFAAIATNAAPTSATSHNLPPPEVVHTLKVHRLYDIEGRLLEALVSVAAAIGGGKGVVSSHQNQNLQF